MINSLANVLPIVSRQPTGKAARRKRMTLIAGFRCKEGIVFCADSQETINVDGVDYRMSVQKIEPHVAEKRHISIAGSGNSTLIESFIIRAQRAVDVSTASSVEQLHTLLESELRGFYEEDVRLCPDEDKAIKLFIAAAIRPAGYQAWVSEGIKLRPMRAWELNGHEEALYRATAMRLYAQDMNIAQGILAGIYVLTIAEETSNYVRGPMSVAIVRENGIWMEESAYIEGMQKRLADYDHDIHRLFLACADIGVHVHELDKIISDFGKAATELHRGQIDRYISSLSLDDVMSRNDPYPKLPRGSLIEFGTFGLRMDHDPQHMEATRQRFRRLQIIGEGGPIKWSIHCKCGNEFVAEAESYRALWELRVFICEKCGEQHNVANMRIEDVKLDS